MGGPGSGRPSSYTPQRWRRFIAEIEKGTPRTKVCARKGQPYLQTVQNWMRDHPELKVEYDAAIEASYTIRRDRYMEKALEAIENDAKDGEGTPVMSLAERDMRARNYARLAQLETSMIASRHKVEHSGEVKTPTEITLNMAGKKP